jgi:hypothetical protein
VAAASVRLVEALEAPSRGEVHIRIPSGQRNSGRQRVALGDTHPSGDAQSLRAATSVPRRIVHAANGQMRIVACTTTGLIDQVGGDSGSPVAKTPSCLGDLVSWKDPL